MGGQISSRMRTRLYQLLKCGAVAGLIVIVTVVLQDRWRHRRPELLSPDNPPSPDSFAPERLLEQQQPITQIKIIAASEVQDEVDPNELVLGVIIDGKARAYPLNGLTGPSREIYNDTLAGRPIAATR